MDRVEAWPREQKQPRKSSETEEVAAEVTRDPTVAERKEMIDEDVDAILDEIDEVLESERRARLREVVHPEGRPSDHPPSKSSLRCGCDMDPG